MRYHLATKSGRWVGGFMVHRAQLVEHVEELREQATAWGEPLIATRLDGPRRGDTIRIEPRAEGER